MCLDSSVVIDNIIKEIGYASLEFHIIMRYDCVRQSEEMKQLSCVLLKYTSTPGFQAASDLEYWINDSWPEFLSAQLTEMPLIFPGFSTYI